MALRRLRNLSLVAVAAAFTQFSNAAWAETLHDDAVKQISDGMVRDAIKDALLNIDKSGCPQKGLPCDPATPAEIADPPVTIAMGKQMLATGAVSALASWCGLDARRSYLPMIMVFQRALKLNDRQLLILAGMHGKMQRDRIEALNKLGQCQDSMRARLEKEMPTLTLR